MVQRNLVLVVHGIGEQAAGQTIDALVGGAIRELGLPGPVESRTEMIAEVTSDARRLRLFPCPIRQTVLPAGRHGFTKDQQVLAGEVCWSDLSPAPRGAIATGFDLLRTVLTLGYLALDNVSQSHEPAHRWIRALVHVFVWIFYALIAPMNALLLMGSILMLTDSFIIPLGPETLHGATLMAILGAVAVVGHLAWRSRLRRPESSYLERCFMSGFGALGAATLVAGLVVRMSLPDVPELAVIDMNNPQAYVPALPREPPFWLEWLRRASCNSVELSACWDPAYQDIAALLWAFTMLMALTWLVAVAVLLAIFMMSAITDVGLWRTAALAGVPLVVILAIQLASDLPKLVLLLALLAVAGAAFARWVARQGGEALGRMTRLFGRRARIYLPICNAMLFLWMLISAAIWSIFAELIKKIDSPKGGQTLLGQLYSDYSGLATSTMSYIVFGLAGLIVAGVVPLLIRQRRKEALALDPESWLDVWCGRVILNPVLNLLLMLLVLWIAFGGALQAVRTAFDVLGVNYRPWNSDTLIGGLIRFHDQVAAYNPMAIALVGMAGIAAYRAADFVSAALGVARDISIYSARTLAYSPDTPGGRSAYAVRERIKARFRSVRDHLARQYPHDRLIVIAHSQGTVIAAQCLQEAGPGDTPIFLVTMGSPLTHIYGQYFARGFDMADLPPQLERWINIYRCDDFVGTDVTLEGGAVMNHRVAPGGHTGYWTDRHVWQAVRDVLAGRMS
ncbi:hypothetical protein [Paracoccus salsus]|uniref:hypothetical protein n=1 Tax=Paracoccus salsus TaxID=2911061 RepID=UPI001F1FF6B0|nr:hypothetical protein [Paracoccus salsus]MCF3972535.1 hypothetical protein [Paracoccus salsus]